MPHARAQVVTNTEAHSSAGSGRRAHNTRRRHGRNPANAQSNFNPRRQARKRAQTRRRSRRQWRSQHLWDSHTAHAPATLLGAPRARRIPRTGTPEIQERRPAIRRQRQHNDASHARCATRNRLARNTQECCARGANCSNNRSAGAASATNRCVTNEDTERDTTAQRRHAGPRPRAKRQKYDKKSVCRWATGYDTAPQRCGRAALKHSMWADNGRARQQRTHTHGTRCTHVGDLQLVLKVMVLAAGLKHACHARSVRPEEARFSEGAELVDSPGQ